MLKPLKDLLTYLQRNANSSNIFGLTTPTAASTTSTMGPNEAPRLEETIIVSDELGLEEGGDPLHDPLALDDCLGPDLNVSNTSVGSEDDDGISPDKIILVDVTTLKPKEENEDERETDDDDAHVEQIHTETPVTVTIEDDDEQPITDLLNGSAEALLELEASESNFIIDRNEVSQIDSEQSSSCNVLDTSAIVEDGIRLSVSPPLADESETTDGVPAQLNGDFVDTIDTVEQDGCSERTGAVVVAGETTTAEQIQGTNGEEEEEASDGSDSGLGLEPARNVTGACASSNSSTSSANNSSSNSPLQRPPIKSSLKRRSEPLGATEREVAEGASSQKRPKKGITFDGVTVYYFPRIQGFGCVPSQGGCTLGMEFQHVHTRRLTLSEHSAEQRKVHRQQLQELNPRSSSSEDTSSEEEPSESGSEAESESYGFLQPVSTRQRRALLKAAGVRKIDPTEKDDCREIRISREVCGCTCRGFCDPNRCACSLAGIKCQVDRPNFPCGCTHEGCANTAGRVEFNPGRVRTHFLHTIMKLRMEGESSKVIEARSGSSNGAMLSRPGSVTASSNDMNGSNYVIGSEKNWSNGPVRLPPTMVGYGAGMHPGPTGTISDMTDGSGSMHQVAGMLHQHSNTLQQHGSHLSHHPPANVLQDGMHHDTDGILHHQQQHHHHHLAPYHNHLAADATHQNYLPTPNSNATSHLIGASGLPSASSNSLNVHYPYRDYYGGLEDGTVRAGGHSGGMPMHQHSNTINSEPNAAAALHANMYYTDNYATFQETAAGASTTSSHIDLYRQSPMVPLHHVPNASGSTSVSRQQMLATGHDRQLQCSSFENGHHNAETMSSTPEKDPGRANDPYTVGVSKVPEQTVNSGNPPAVLGASLDVPSSSNVSSNGPIMMRLFPPAPADSDAENCDLNVTVISDSSRSTLDLDSSGEVTILEPPEDLPSEGCVIDDRDEEEDYDGHSGARATNRTKRRIADFIDLETPQADNMERLEAINDLLESSRHTRSIVQRSIVAEEDDELRDFQHPPAEPSVVICLEADEAEEDAVCVDRVTRSAKPTRAGINDSEGNPARSLNSQCTLTNGTNQNGKEEQQHQKRMRCSTIGEESNASLKKILRKDSEDVSFVSSYTIPMEQQHVPAVVSSGSSLLVSGPSVSSLSSTTALEPSENLCEIIKNSIVETAVSH